MDVREWVTSRGTQERVKRFAYYAHSPMRGAEFCYGRAKGYVIDPKERIAVLLEGLGDSQTAEVLYVLAGDFVHYRTPHPEMPKDELRIDGVATVRTDHRQPKIPCPNDVMPAELERQM